ncbi:MAG: 2-C-methyl-D-erythritol 4-phosphate cytidylyltransferase [Chloroflexi bacterium]|nr:2-C-methyl-D-erythritol 4-phosphate cytidylyltransferase [Chloroflexota bacterium]
MGGTDKLFAAVAGRPVLAWVLDTFQSCAAIDEIVLVLAKENLSRGRQMVLKGGWQKVSNVCPGGPRRRDSVLEGLGHLGDCNLVAIHDGARPCLTADVIERGIAAAESSGAAIAAVPVTDTVKRTDPDRQVLETIDRSGLWSIQTPQVFDSEVIKKAHQANPEDVTDDAALVEKLGHPVKVYMGSYLNIKITTPEDLAIAEAILRVRRQATSL